MKFCSVQVRPESQYSTGQGPFAAWGGKYTPTFMSQPSVSEPCRYTSCQPPKLARCSMRSILVIPQKISFPRLRGKCPKSDGGAAQKRKLCSGSSPPPPPPPPPP